MTPTILRVRMALLGLLLSLTVHTARGAEPDLFLVTDAAADHYLASHGDARVHVVRAKKGKARLLIAFPAGNAGALLDFGEASAPIASVQVLDVRTSSAPDTGVTLRLTFAGQAATLEAAMPGALPELQRFAQTGQRAAAETIVASFEAAAGGLDPAARKTLAAAGVDLEQPRRSLSPAWRAGGRDTRRLLTLARAEFLGPRQHTVALLLPGACKALGGRTLKLSCPEGEPLVVDVEATVPYASPGALQDDELLAPGARSVLAEKQTHVATDGAEEFALLDRAFASLRFLACRDRLLAASADALTYRGHDTLLTARMLLPVAAAPLLEAAWVSVLSRLGPDGAVADAETVGNEAILRRIERFSQLLAQGKRDEALAVLKAWNEPVRVWQRVDDDLLLAPLARDLVTGEGTPLSAEARTALLAGPDGKRLDGLARYLEHVLVLASDASVPAQGLARSHPEAPANWRDSDGALAKGRYPGDINAYLMPAAIIATAETLRHDLAARMGLRAVVGTGDFPHLERVLLDPAWVDSLLRKWEAVGKRHRVTQPLPHARSAVSAWLATRPAAEAAWFRARPLTAECTLGEFAAGQCYPPDLAEGLTFGVLALSADGSPVPVMTSDGVLALFDSALDTAALEQHLRLFTLPYPLGLWTPVGPASANAVHTGDKSMWDRFAAGAPHGATVYGWVPGMLELAVSRQKDYLVRMEGECGRACDELKRVTAQLARMRKLVPAVAPATAWTWQVEGDTLVPAPARNGPGGITGNAAQLWSAVWLAVFGE